jgi:hypothetical protein
MGNWTSRLVTLGETGLTAAKMSGIMLTRVLAVSTALLAALVIHQYSTISQLRSDVVAAQTQALTDARASVADSMEGQGDEVQRVMMWLNDFYKSPSGLQRPEGLWIDGHPDFQGLSVWVFDVYLRRRLRGDSDDQARKAVESAIRESDEWRVKHPGRG